MKQLESELASPMAGQATAKDREHLKLLQVRLIMTANTQA